MRCLSAFFLLTAVLLVPLPLQAKDGDAHVADMRDVFGKSNKQSELRTLFRAITNNIDSRGTDDLNQKIKQLCHGHGKFSEGEFNHRLYFHWPFNGGPEDSPAFVQSVNLATTNELIRAEIFSIVREAHHQRRRNVLLQVQIAANAMDDRSTGLKSKHMDVIASLAWDVHILGDYIKGDARAMSELFKLDKLNDDITRAFRTLTKYDKDFRDNQPRWKRIMKQFKRHMKKAEARADAERMLNIMKRDVPSLLLMSGPIRKSLGLIDPNAQSETSQSLR